MSTSINPISRTNDPDSTRSIRRRLWLLLLRAFGIVILLIVLLTLSATLIFLGVHTNLNPFYHSPLSYLLEAYYYGNGSWDGVQNLFTDQSNVMMPYLQREWSKTLLLNPQNHILVDHGMVDSARIGTIYEYQNSNRVDQIEIKGRVIGILVFDRGILNTPIGPIVEILPPIGSISMVLGLLTLVIGLLLMRRVVDPLSEVIAASGAVAEGNLSARVPLHRHHDDLYALSASFNQMADSLQRSDQQRRALLADVAHELRTPLSVLRGRLEGIVDGIYPATEANIATALEEVYLLNRLVDDLRLLTQAEARQLPLEIRPFDLNDLARKVIATFEPEGEELGLSLGFAPLPGNHALTSGDPQRVEQVIGNLVGNALRYVPEGGDVKVRIQEDGNQMKVFVSDTGPGVPDDELSHIFDRFWRGEKSRCRDSGGAGLGLAIARQLVEAMGGEIGAKNLPGSGFEVWFSLPITQP